MKPTETKIIVRVDLKQKGETIIGGRSFQMAKQYEHNNRIKSPVIAYVVKGNDQLRTGDAILCHHNLFVDDSPYYYKDDLFSITANKNTIFFRIDSYGEPIPVYENIIAERVDKKSSLLELPKESTNQTIDRVICSADGFGYKKGQTLFTIPYSMYEIVYIFGGTERRLVKIHLTDIVAFSA
jgi:hypothetical protein